MVCCAVTTLKKEPYTRQDMILNSYIKVSAAFQRVKLKLRIQEGFQYSDTTKPIIGSYFILIIICDKLM